MKQLLCVCECLQWTVKFDPVHTQVYTHSSVVMHALSLFLCINNLKQQYGFTLLTERP